MYKLPRRLQIIADLIPENRRVLDVGTDHGLLLFSLAQAGKLHQGIGLDKAQMPLFSAKHTCSELGFEDVIEFRLSNGLECVDLQEMDVIVLAGMGGHNMVSILSQIQTWPKSIQVIVQPNRDWPLLREALSLKGWSLKQEEWLQHKGHFYSTMLWDIAGGHNALSEEEILLGLEVQQDDPVYQQWLLLEKERHLRIPIPFQDQRVLGLIQTRMTQSMQTML